MSTIRIHTDGGARGNPGPAAIGVVVKNESGAVLKKISRKIGEVTNNVAEYSAVIAGLEWLKSNVTMKEVSNVTIHFFLDSTLVVNQLNGLFRVKDSNLRNLLLHVRQLEQEAGGTIFYTYIPREKNYEADILVNQALDNG